MKNVMAGLCVAVSLLLFVPTVHAQSADVTGGSIMLTLDPTFVAVLSGQGVSSSVLCPIKSGVTYPFLAASSGNFDLSTGVGSISGSGVMAFKTAAGALRIYNMMFENYGAYPVITGSFYLNGHFMGRNTVLTVSSPNAMHTPLAAGNLLVGGMQASIAPFLSLMLTHSFGVTIPGTTQGGTVAINVGLVVVGS